MASKIREILNKWKIRRNSAKVNKKILLLNTLGFFLILLLSLDESNLYVKILLLIYVLVNLSLFLVWRKIHHDIDLLIFTSNAFISFVTAYDFYSRDSRYVYIVYIFIGFVFLIQAIIKVSKKGKN